MASKWIFAGPPVIVLVVGLIWYGHEDKMLHRLEADQQTLRKNIHVAQSHARKDALPKGKVDWRAMLDRDLESPFAFGTGDVRLKIELRRRALEMTGEQLVSMIDEIEASDASYEKKIEVEALLMNALEENDPALLLSALGKWPPAYYLHVEQVYITAFRNYLRQDPSAAVAWLDQNFKDRSSSYLAKSFEQIAVEQSMRTNPAAAKARLMALPEEDRANLFHGASIQPGQETAWADLIRTSTPPEESAAIMAHAFATRSIKSLADVDRLLDAISASDGEKSAIVQASLTDHAMDPDSHFLDLGRLDEARTWAMTRSPEMVDSIVGGMLRGIGGGAQCDGEDPPHPNFEEAAEVALRYASESKNDTVLEVFLDGYGAGVHAAEALPLCDKISDPVRREEIRRKLEEKLDDAPKSGSSE